MNDHEFCGLDARLDVPDDTLQYDCLLARQVTLIDALRTQEVGSVASQIGVH